MSFQLVMNRKLTMKQLIDHLAIALAGFLTATAFVQAQVWEHPAIIAALAGLLGSVATGIIKIAIEWHKSGQTAALKIQELMQADRKLMIEQNNAALERLQLFYESQIAQERANRHEVVNQLHAFKSAMFALRNGASMEEIAGKINGLALYDVSAERAQAKELQEAGQPVNPTVPTVRGL